MFRVCVCVSEFFAYVLFETKAVQTNKQSAIKRDNRIWMGNAKLL